MGKSTLLDRLTLHMAARGLHHPDSDMPAYEKLMPVLLPVLLRLNNYAKALAEKADLSLPEHLYQILNKMNLPGLAAFIQQCLLDGTCLVLLDGLDEVSDPERREKVQKEIREWISGNAHRSHFIITSRVAGYDQAAFPAFPHFTLAELTEEDIRAFLPRWCRANIDRERLLRKIAGQVNINQEVEQRVKEIERAIKDNQGVRQLAKNPLLLTLLLVIQQNSIVLPQRRVELYDIVTKTLLEKRNLAKDLEPISEFQAIERLGPLAFQMQESDSDFIRQQDVEVALMQVIRLEGGTEEQVHKEAERFLSSMCERSGLFVSRVGDYFGFMHRTFQEYFVARYILNNIKTDQQRWIDELIQRATHQGAVWREPFLLAIAYQSGENERIAGQIIHELLTHTHTNAFEQEVSMLLLATDAIIEAVPLTIEAKVQKEVGERLLTSYEQALHQRNGQFHEIMKHFRDWLLSLPQGAYRLPLLDVITQAIKNDTQISRQRSTLLLLENVMQQMDSYPSSFFSALIPPLLALTGIPAINVYVPTAGLAASTDLDIASLALNILSFLGKPSITSLYLKRMREYFQERPEQLRLLAYYSLESGTLITPVAIPLAEENYQSYISAIKQWLQLHNHREKHLTEQSISSCVNIHQALLTCAEEASYPTTIYLLEMLQLTEIHVNQPWSEIWQTYLLKQLSTENYLHYYSATLLWHALFPEKLEPLVEIIMSHYTMINSVRKKYAQRFLSYLATYIEVLYTINEFKVLRTLTFSRDFFECLTNNTFILHQGTVHITDFLASADDFKFIRHLDINRDFTENARETQGEFEISYLRNKKLVGPHILLRISDYMAYLKGRISFKLENGELTIRDLSRLRDLSIFLITRDNADIARIALASASEAEKIDLLSIIAGRVLLIQIEKEYGGEIENELRELVHAILQELARPDRNTNIRAAALAILSHLPARTADEIALLWSIADNARDKDIYTSCANALLWAKPVDEAAWQKLENGKTSTMQPIREAIDKRIKRKDRAGQMDVEK